MSNDPHQNKITFNSLPREVRHYILSFTALVPPSGGVVVRKGRLSDHRLDDCHHDTCPCPNCGNPFPGLNLLNVRNKLLREDAHFILFSRNKIIFSRHPAGHLQFLKEKQAWIHYIRNMCFTFTELQIDEWITGGIRLCINDTHSRGTQIGTGPPALDQTWIAMAQFIKENIPLETLFITLNAWEAREGYVISECYKDVLPNTLDSYKSIVAPFRGWGRQGLKKFWCIWPLFMEYEEEAEREVMGSDYVVSGKLAPELRW